MSGLLRPEMREVEPGPAEVRAIFRTTRIGAVRLHGPLGDDHPQRARAAVRDGVSRVRRQIGLLRRFKDDVREVARATSAASGSRTARTSARGTSSRPTSPRGRPRAVADMVDARCAVAVRPPHPGCASSRRSATWSRPYPRSAQVQRGRRRGRLPGPLATNHDRRGAVSGEGHHVRRVMHEVERLVDRLGSVEVIDAADAPRSGGLRADRGESGRAGRRGVPGDPGRGDPPKLKDPRVGS